MSGSLSAPESRRAEARRLTRLDQAAAALVSRSSEAQHQDEAATLRTFFSRRWICFHLATCLLAIAMVWLGIWQLQVSDDAGFALQNFSYWLQWWAFAAFTVYMWARTIRLARRPPADRRSDGVVLTAPDAPGTGVAVRTSGGLAPVAGAVELVSPTSTPAEPVVYRGYVMPKAADQPTRSHGDAVHDEYNDYLWMIALADGEQPQDKPAS